MRCEHPLPLCLGRAILHLMCDSEHKKVGTMRKRCWGVVPFVGPPYAFTIVLISLSLCLFLSLSLSLCLSPPPPPPFSTQVFFQAADAPTCSQQDCYCLGRRIYNALTDKTNWSWLRGWWGSRQIHSRERITILCRSNAHACTMEQQSELPTMSHKCHPPNRICVVVSESVQYVDLFRLSTGGHSTLSSSPFN
jgi:hypothetical protein